MKSISKDSSAHVAPAPMPTHTHNVAPAPTPTHTHSVPSSHGIYAPVPAPAPTPPVPVPTPSTQVDGSQKEGRRSVTFGIDPAHSSSTVPTSNLSHPKDPHSSYLTSPTASRQHSNTPVSHLSTPSEYHPMSSSRSVNSSNSNPLQGSMPDPYNPGSVVSNHGVAVKPADIALNLGGHQNTSAF